jgi:hypothetical protein
MTDDSFFQMLRKLAVDEGAICIAPHQREFRRYERDFLDRMRHIPSSISNPAGTNPYSMALGMPGRWLMVWIPDKEV